MKNKTLTLIVLVCIFSMNTFAQTYISKKAKISFFSKASIENIEAVNNEVTSLFDASKGEFSFVGLIKGFKFKKALMEEHFNDNYMESSTYPKTNFKGVITDMSKVNFTKNGIYNVRVKGDLTIHGVTKNVEAPGTITISGGKVSAKSKFSIRVKDFGIKVPAMYVNNIAELIEITVDSKYESFKKAK